MKSRPSSLSGPLVELQQPAKPLAADDLAGTLGRRLNEHIVQPLMGTLRVIMLNVL